MKGSHKMRRAVFNASYEEDITTTSLPRGQRGRFYRQNLQATGGSGSFVWSISAGQLPPGMWLNSQTGRIHGKAALKGVWIFTVRAEDTQNSSVFATKDLMIEVKLFADF